MIKTAEEYASALKTIDSLLARDPDPGTPEAETLELLSLLVEDYESKATNIPLPDPIDAIEFRMEQQNLTPRDLIPFIGGRSKVSEILSRKRPLTLSMIRALHSGLGIPAGSLIRRPDTAISEIDVPDWDSFPVREMSARGWFGPKPSSQEPRKLLEPFFAASGQTFAAALFRQTVHIRSGREMNFHALIAWTARVLLCAKEVRGVGAYKSGAVTPDFMRMVGQLSRSEKGPLKAQALLASSGIPLVIEPHLPRTHLDGAALLVWRERPVIGLTLRHDRLDNFWFCLMHELAHIAIHFSQDVDRFFDDLDVQAETDQREQEADALAGEVLIPNKIWARSPASRLRSPDAVNQLADQLSIHPAIVAGRMRHHFKSYRLFPQLVGYGEVRKLFPATCAP